MVEVASTICLIAIVGGVFGSVYSGVLNSFAEVLEVVNSSLLPKIVGHVDGGVLFLEHRGGKPVKGLSLYVNDVLFLSRMDFVIGDIIFVNVSVPCMVRLFDFNHNLLFYSVW